MIEYVEFENFRNLSGKYEFDDKMNIVVGKNNTGKTNLIDGLKLAFSIFTDDYFKITKSDFFNSDDSSGITISVKLKSNSIPELNQHDERGLSVCGFKWLISKTPNNRYNKKLVHLLDVPIDREVLEHSPNLPNISVIPVKRIEDIYSSGLTLGVRDFIESEDTYIELRNAAKSSVKSQIKHTEERFLELARRFNNELSIELSDPKLSDEKLYIVDGELEHNKNIGAGYKSVANVILNSITNGVNILLVDEIENHLHPALVRNLMQLIKSLDNLIIIATTHSPVVLNEAGIDNVIHISKKRLKDISDKEKNKLNTFLHPGRGELILADNVLLVEGYSEELLINHYVRNNSLNWTVVNVAGVMFDPYIELAVHLGKKVVVLSDNDISLSETLEKSSRFKKLSELCKSKGVKILETHNTLETDLYESKLLNDELNDMLVAHKNHKEIKVAKKGTKTEFAMKIIESNVNLSEWHVIKDVVNEFSCN